MRRYGLYIFDLDGTLYRGADVVSGAVETLTTLRASGAAVRFLTNNSSQTPEAQAAKLRGFGFEADPAEVLTSGVGAALALRREEVRRVFLVGEAGLREVLAAHDIACVEDGDGEEDAPVVLVGICREFTYAWLWEAMRRIRAGAAFVATNTDATYPVEEGRLIPGAGAIVAAIETCAERSPRVIGKPEPFLIEMMLAETGIASTDTLVVGDRVETDIEAGLRAGCDTLLVPTGVSRQAPPGVRMGAISDLVS